MKSIDELAVRLAKLDTRTTIQELNQIAYAGAKLGMAKYGIEGLEGFTRAANQVNVALKEDLGADALTALSKITEVMGLIPKMGVEQSMLATGSAMFQLAATSTATAGNIVEFSKRLTGMARTAGITTDQAFRDERSVLVRVHHGIHGLHVRIVVAALQVPLESSGTGFHALQPC